MDERALIASFSLNVDARHAERVMGMIDALLKQSRTALCDLDAIAVSIGPGSFTGLRVGLATAKGLAIGAALPLVLVSALEVMATAFPYALPLIAPFIDARRGEVYTALFCYEGGVFRRLSPDTTARPEDVLDAILSSNVDPVRRVLFTGDGAEKYKDLIVEKMGRTACFAPKAMLFPSPLHLAERGLERFFKGEVTPPECANPVYLRASTPELKRTETAEK